jgi:hypothetical protein
MTGDNMYTFLVIGSGDFPYSLLSTQSCFPATETDAKSVFELSYSRRTISMKSIRAPSPNLWKSFGWTLCGAVTACGKEDYTKYHTWPC